jgi:hypothetical protein
MSDRGPIPAEQVNQALEDAGILGFFEPTLIIYGKKNSPAVFEFAARQTGAPDRRLGRQRLGFKEEGSHSRI